MEIYLLGLIFFLLHSKEIVKVETYNSHETDITFRVPQGSHLEPLLSNIFINDAGNCF